MPTLDVRGEAVNTTLAINYHSTNPPDDLQKRFLAESLDLARTILAYHVLPALIGAQKVLARQTDYRIVEMELDKKSPIGLPLLPILRSNFMLPEFSGTYDLNMFYQDIWTIKDIFERTSAGINEHMVIADSYASVLKGKGPSKAYLDEKKSALAYKDEHFRKTGKRPEKVPAEHLASVHIDFGMLRFTAVSSPLTVARTIIHESSHKFGLTKDFGYRRWDEKFMAMTKREAMDNADSYAYAAVSIFKKMLITMMPDDLDS